MAAAVAGIIGTLCTFVMLLVGPAADYRRRNRWLVRPVVEITGPRAFLAEVAPVVSRTEGELHPLGFEPYVTFRTLLGYSAGRSVWSFYVMWRRLASSDLAHIQWDQWVADGKSPWSSSVVLHIDRHLDPVGEARASTVLADRVGGKTIWSAEEGAIASAYARIVADEQSTTVRRGVWADPDDYLSAWKEYAAAKQAKWLADQAKPDPSGQWYVYTWKLAVKSILGHQFGSDKQSPTSRGFDVVPVAPNSLPK